MRDRPASKPAAPAGSGSGQYRPALDGVRAAAVLAVIAYHVTDGMGGSWLNDRLADVSKGGFLGVDIFFVLSGYLITTLLLRERVAEGRLRLGQFWLRRGRRLLPALLLLLGIVALVTAFSTPLVEATERRGDMLATLFYFANWHFIATDASYFAGFLGASPLRHMWSLAIEEQYYVVWPLVLGGALYLARGRRGALLGLLAAGVVVSSLLMASDYDSGFVSRAYFATNTHAAPLLVGSALAVLLNLRPELLSAPAPRRLARWAAPAACALIVAALVTFSDQGTFYYHGGLVLFALAVAGLLWALDALPDSAPARFFSLRPVVWIGVISYGLYLWHWPLLLWIGDVGGNSVLTAALVVAATFGVATLSFYLLERPVREQRVPGIGGSWRRLVLGFAALFLIVGSAATAAPRVSRWSQNVDPEDAPASTPCPADSPGFANPTPGNDYRWCMLVNPSGPRAPVIASVGDSTSGSLSPGLSELATEHGWGYVQAGQDSCSLLPNASIADPNDVQGVAVAQSCVGSVSKVIAGVRRDFDPDIWIISDHVLSFSAVASDGTVMAPGSPELNQLITAEMTRRLRQLTAHGDQAVLLEVVPLGPPEECAGIANADCGYDSYAEEATNANNLLRDAVARAGGRTILVSIADFLCPGGECPVELDGTVSRYDGTHYTLGSSRLVAREIVKQARSAGLDLGPVGSPAP